MKTLSLPEQIRTLEELAVNAWPALQTLTVDGWVLRFAEGYTRRANSVTPLYPSTLALDEKIGLCEELYRAAGLDVTFKMTPACLPEGLDEELEKRGYFHDADTVVQTLDLSMWGSSSFPGLTIHPAPEGVWFEALCELNQLSPVRQPVALQMLKSLRVPAAYATLTRDGQVVACGLGVQQGAYVGLFDIVAHPACRRQGLGEKIVRGLMEWGRSRGASTAYLQVMTNNPPALSLYQKLGFKSVYPYWYRVKRL